MNEARSARIRDVSGFVRLFYILSKNKFFRDFSDKYSLFLANNIVISINYYNFFFKILFFIKIKNKRTKPDVSLSIIWLNISNLNTKIPSFQKREESINTECK